MSSLAEQSPPVAPGLVFVRIAGLPAETMAPFASPFCLDRLALLAAAEAELAAARQVLVDTLFPLVGGAVPEVRRFLLAVKRDAFNGRPIAGHAARREWRLHLAAALGAGDRVLALEDAAAAARQEFELAYAAEAARESRALSALLSEGPFLRAVALSSRLAAAQLSQLAAAPDPAAPEATSGRREKRLQSSALRYLSRAACKLSPFSSFTPVALGALDPAAETVEILAEEYRERSLVRVQPAFLDQVSALLLSHPAFQAGLAAQINPTLEEIAPGTVRWFRPGHWLYDGDQRAMRYTPDAFLKVALKDPLMIWLSRRPEQSFASFEALRSALGAELPELAGTRLASRLEQLRRLGFLLLHLPWPSNGVPLEGVMASRLAASADPGLRRLGGALETLARLEEELPAAAAAGPAIARLDRQVDEIWSLARQLERDTDEVPYVRIKENQFFDDVLRVPAGNPSAPLLRLPARRLATLLEQAEPLMHLSSLADSRFDFLHHLEALLAEHWPAAGEVGIFEAFDRAKALFGAYAEYEKDPRGAESFDRGGLRAVAELAELRREVRAAAAAAAVSADGITTIDAKRLCSVAAGIPRAYRSEVGPCLFVQPADAEGRLWVANRIYEGTGRYSSRFTALLDPAAHARFAAPFVSRSGDGGAGRPYLLDLLHAQGDTLNVHRTLTARLLIHPGENADAEPGAPVRLEDLRVRRGGADGLPALVDLAGRRYLPVHLGGAAGRYLPTLFRFLSFFGPSDLRLHQPASHLRPLGNARIRERLILGDLVLQRQRWIFDQEDLPPELFSGSLADAYRAVDGWRRRHAMPEKVFLIENVHHPHRLDLYKPQYLDLGSPLFVALLGAALKAHRGLVSFEEMLPEPRLAPAGGGGRGFLVEVMAERQVCGT